MVVFSDPNNDAAPSEEMLQEVPSSSLTTGTPSGKRLSDIREHVTFTLPSYMVPSAWLVVHDIPQTTTGKLAVTTVDAWLKGKDLSFARSAGINTAAAHTLTPPQGASEIILQEIWASVLEIPENHIVRESKFLHLGGDSISAMRVATQAQKRGVSVSTLAILRSSTLAAAAAGAVAVAQSEVQETKLGSLSPSRSHMKPSPVAVPSAEEMAQANQHLRLQSEEIESIAKATDAQAGMVAISEMDDRALLLTTGLEFPRGADRARIEKACARLIRHHDILRTVFLQSGSNLYNVVLKRPPVRQVQPGGFASTSSRGHMHPFDNLPRFYTSCHGQICHDIRLEIHHALYDAISLDLLWKDFARAYSDLPLSSGPSFHQWVSLLSSQDHEPARRFWTEYLSGSTPTHLTPPSYMDTDSRVGQVDISVSPACLQVPDTTTADVLKAAWAVALARTLGIQDVSFAELVANRNSPLLPSDINQDEVRGPCLNANVVRARIDPNASFSSLAVQLHEQSLAAFPHRHLGYLSTIRDCTDWPSSVLFSSVVNYQNHGALKNEPFVMGEEEGEVEAIFMKNKASPGRGAAIWLIGYPSTDRTIVQFHYYENAFTKERVQTLARCVQEILESRPTSLRSWLGAEDVLGTDSEGTNSYSSNKGTRSIGRSIAFDEVSKIIFDTWREVGLLSPTTLTSDQASLFECRGDYVTALLLAMIYRRHGYHMSLKDIVQNPSREAQVNMLRYK